MLLMNLILDLNSDWYIYNIHKWILPVSLYNLKFVSKCYYENINDNMINKKIIDTIHDRLKQCLESQYDLFIKYILKNEIVINDVFIIQCILGEYWDDKRIILYSYQHDENKHFDDILPNYKTENKNLLDVIKLNDHNNDYDYEYEDEDEDQDDDNMEKLFTIPNIDEMINNNLTNGIKLHKSIYKTDDNINSFEELKNNIIRTSKLSLSKTLFAMTNIDSKLFSILYIHDLNKIINKKEKLISNNFTYNVTDLISYYEPNKFKFEFEFPITNFMKYSHTENICDYCPFLVYKTDNDNCFEKITFLDKVFDKHDINQFYKFYDGQIPLGNNTETHIILNISLLQSVIKETIMGQVNPITICECPLQNILNIGHHHYYCQFTYNRYIYNNDKHPVDFIMINYDNLNEDFKLEYDKIFHNKNIKNDKFLTYQRFYKSCGNYDDSSDYDFDETDWLDYYRS